jgi:4-azaleucine resistance transporter AzlC
METVSERVRTWGADVIGVMKELGAVCAGKFGLGIGFGMLAANYGFDWWVAPLLSLTMYAGSVEFLLVGMFAAGVPFIATAVTTLMVNSRHLFYGLTFPISRLRHPAARAYSVFTLSDESYAVLTPERVKAIAASRMLTTQLCFHLSWAFGTLTGSLLGGLFVSNVAGLDFLLTALFLVLSIDAYRANPSPAVLTLAVVAAGLGLLLSSEFMLPIAMALLVFALPLLNSVHTLMDRRRQEVVTDDATEDDDA